MFKILVLTFMLIHQAKSANLNQLKFWLASCTAQDCTKAFNSCFNCFGERSCKSCISVIKPECSACADDIFNKNDLEIIDGNQYLICDDSDQFQEKVCHIFCRGQYFQTGQCIRFQNFPVCRCSSNTNIFSSSTTTSLINNYNISGNLKLQIITTQYERIFGLRNGDILRGGRGSTLQVLDSQTGLIKRNITTNYYNSFVFGLLSNGDLVVGYLTNKTLVIMDLSLDDPIKRVIQTSEEFRCLAVLNNNDLVIGQLLLVDSEIIIRDSLTGHIKQKLIGHSSTVYQLLTLPDNKLISCSFDKTVRIWNPLTGELIKTLFHNYIVNSIVLLDNNFLASGLQNGVIQIWDLNTYVLIKNLDQHSNSICSTNCLLKLNAKELISASRDKSIIIWNSNDFSIRSVLKLHQSNLEQMCLLQNGTLASISSNEIFIWS